MAKYIIQGGQKLGGMIVNAGAKNNALKVLPAALLTTEPCLFHNVPEIEDVHILLEIMTALGVKVEKLGGGDIRVQADNVKSTDLDEVLARKLRSSIMLVAPLLARYQQVSMPHPGGCVIGKRPIDFFIDGFEQLGSQLTWKDSRYYFTAKQLHGATIVFPQISHTGTESMIIAAVLAAGSTRIVNAACEPEVVALAEMLNQMGAKIQGAGTPFIEIEGVKKLNGTEFTIIPDRLETGSFIALAAVNRQSLTITNCNPEHLQVPLSIFTKIGVKLEVGKSEIKVQAGGDYQGIKLSTHEYPGFPTDLQAPTTVLLTQAQGQSLVHETIYESRLFYTDLLNRLGANIILCDPHRVIVQGPSKLYGRPVESPDLRAGIAMIIAASIAEGKTEIDNIYQIERGYENIVSRFQGIGLSIRREE